MRHVLIAAAALLGACSVETSGGEAANTPAGGYEMQIAAREAGQIIYVTGPEGHASAARVENGASQIMDVNEARLALGEARAAVADLGEAPKRLAIRGPGFELSVAAAEDGGEDNGRAQISINAAGRQVNIDAGGSDVTGNALVRISGASADNAREFIQDSEELSSETKQQMLEQLGLAEPH